jgi:peptidyl-prolyl cis-trans isomerase SDCCAG10
VDKLKLTAEGKGAAAGRKRMAEVPDAQLLTRFQQSLAEHRQRKRARGVQEQDVLNKLRSFKSHLQSGKSGKGSVPVKLSASETAAVGASKASAPYSGQVNEDIDHRAYLPPAWRVRTWSASCALHAAPSQLLLCFATLCVLNVPGISCKVHDVRLPDCQPLCALVQIDKYLEGSEDTSLAALASHPMHWDESDQVADPTARKHNVDDYKVIDPLLEAGKAEFNRKQQHAKKRASEWAGRPNM